MSIAHSSYNHSASGTFINPKASYTASNGIASQLAASKSLQGDQLEKTFHAAVELIKSLPRTGNASFQPSHELLLKFYAYYKHATFGACKTSRPSMFKVVERAKWDAWNSVRHMSREQAMNAYIDEIKNIVETMPHSDTVQRFLEILGPFYEFVNESETKSEQNGHEDIKLDLKENGAEDDEEDDEDYCDTSDTMQQDVVKSLKSKLNGAVNGTNGFDNDDIIMTEINNNYKVANGYAESHMMENDVDVLINKFGGESGSGQQYQTRPSRPNSTQSVHRLNSSLSGNNTRDPNVGGGGGLGGGSGGGYNPPPNDPYLGSHYGQSDANRQILMVLMRLQQDTNNVLTRLSYLEATVMSIQNGLQMNRIENSMQIQKKHLRSSSHSSLDSSSWQGSFLINFFRSLDWKSVTVAVVLPFIIRLVFMVLRKVKFIM